ncbi:MAG: zinc-dependent metalloprotease [Armatimonas sp.]
MTIPILFGCAYSLLWGGCLLISSPAQAQQTEPTKAPKTIADFTKSMVKKDGFLPLYWEEKTGKLWMEISRLDQELLYVTSLPTGLGSNEIGLDRGQIGGGRIVRFQRVGPTVFLVQPNYAFRADSKNADERRAVEEAFATSILASFSVEAEEAGRVLVEITPFARRDAHGIGNALAEARQSGYSLDGTRSTIAINNTRAFPKNTEIESILTFAGGGGNAVSTIAPTVQAITLHQRQSFIALPEPGFKSRSSDPRAGFFTLTYEDFTAPLGDDMTRRFLIRHRLKKKDPAAPVSEPVKPIVYYVDRGAPEPIRTALREGAAWWNQAFEAAGYKNAFRVELLPEGADPMDIRYNVIQWVPRDVRGWSYGASIVDPRTGEILKGQVVLDARRARYDYLLAEGLLAPYKNSSGSQAMEKMVLARIRQLAVHEVGHTLGLRHNYQGSSQGRSSVMDYPSPLVTIKPDGSLDLSNAYSVGVGAWDKVAIRYGYQEFSQESEEKPGLERILAQARQQKLSYLTDEDATGGVHPEVSRWDSATDAVTELDRTMRVRRIALKQFGENAIPFHRPLATLEEALVPVYLHHRYQAQAAAALLGGQRYTYALRGDGQVPVRPVPAVEQERALTALLATLKPSELALPRPLLMAIPPRPTGYSSSAELFSRYTGRAFDSLSPASVAADMTISLLLDPERGARLVQQHAIDRQLPGLATLYDRLIATVLEYPVADLYQAEIARLTRRILAERFMETVQSAPMPAVRAMALLKLEALRNRLVVTFTTRPLEESERADRALLEADIKRFLARPQDRVITLPRLTVPLGSPLGNRD